jgi:hypothetical protein
MQMRRNRYAVGILAVVAAGILQAEGQGSPSDPLSLAQKQVVRYVAKLADLHCTEIVTQQKLNAKGHVDETEKSQFDYLIMMGGSSDELQLNESRVESPGARHKMAASPMLITNGVSTALLLFHPYFSDAFTFQAGPEELIGTRMAIPIHFAHISGRRTPAALALRGREFPLELQGTAWLDKASGEVIQVNAKLMGDMSDVGLRSLEMHVEYKREIVGNEAWTLPARAVVEVSTPRQHWRNTHEFASYKSFSTDAEQDPNYKIHADPPTGAASGADKQINKEHQ